VPGIQEGMGFKPWWRRWEWARELVRGLGVREAMQSPGELCASLRALEDQPGPLQLSERWSPYISIVVLSTDTRTFLSLQNYLTRNFYNLRFLALFVCFAINFILLFYKVRKT